jgi:hypothetical protein
MESETMRELHGTWTVKEVDEETVSRLEAAHVPDELAVELGVDIVADPNREDDAGYVWSLLRRSRQVRDVVPGSAVVIGSDIGRYLAKVVSWDFEVSDEDPIVTMELLPVSPEQVQRALARSRL